MNINNKSEPVINHENNSGNNKNELQKAFAESIRSISMSGLYGNGVDVDSIMDGHISALASSVFSLTISEGEYDTGFYLRPQSAKEGVNACLITLAAEVAHFCINRPDAIIRYLMQAAGSVSLYRLFISNKNLNQSTQSLAIFRQYMCIDRNEDALNWAWHAAPLLTDAYKIDTNHKPGPHRELIERLSLVLSQDENQNKTLHSSAFILLGLIERIINLDQINDVTPLKILSVLSRSLRIPTISSPLWQLEGVSLKEYNALSKKPFEKGNFIYRELAKDIYVWLKENNMRNFSVSPSSLLIGKIWTRIYFNLNENMRKPRIITTDLIEVKIHETSPRDISPLNFSAECILRGFFIEEHAHHTSSNEKSRLSDFSNINELPWRNLAQLALSSDCPMSKLIASCPIFIWLFDEEDVS